MGKPIIWSGANAKLINSGDLIDCNNNSLTNGGKITVTQASHGWTSSDIGRPLYLNGTTWTLAQADTAAKAEVAGFIYSVIDANTLLILLGGEIPAVGANFLEGGGSLTAGTVYFLSPTTAGKVTATEPTTIGQISAPVGVASSTTTLYVAPKRGVVVGGTNARTQITLSAVTTAQSIYTAPTGVEAGELTGWVYLDATSDLKFYVSAPFAKNGAGTNWNISPSYVGDAIPSGFSMTMTSGGVIQITMSSLPTGYTTGYVNYAINAPAVGATFPLAVSGTSVTGGTPTVDTINEYTSTNGVQIKGRTSGSTIAAGYVGQEILSVQANANWTAGSTNYGDVTTVTLTAGIWKINGFIGIVRNSVTFSAIELRGYFTSTAGNSVSGVINNVTAIYADAAYPTTFTFIPLVMPEITVISNGTDLIIKDGSNTTYTSTQILRLKLDVGVYASGTPQVGGFLRAIRIA